VDKAVNIHKIRCLHLLKPVEQALYWRRTKSVQKMALWVNERFTHIRSCGYSSTYQQMDSQNGQNGGQQVALASKSDHSTSKSQPRMEDRADCREQQAKQKQLPCH
jgi:hypothetical protein